jgi:hypothetical protein
MSQSLFGKSAGTGTHDLASFKARGSRDEV